VKLRQLLIRLLSGRDGRSAAEQARYDNAARLEERTQAHYRSVTDSEAHGRPSKDSDSSNSDRSPLPK
jgi:hypothetical protein